MPIDTIAVTLITQGSKKFYSGTMDIELIAEICTTNPRSENPELGFQRSLSEERANSIAEYIRAGGTIPSSIILSAQSSANLKYTSKNRSVSFEVEKNSFLILDGQHRVYGFRKLVNEGLKYRIPVIIYSDLTIVDEARIFIDINTLQKPVPRELLLDIKKLAETESEQEILLDSLFTSFEQEKSSYLLNKLSRIEKKKGKISKVTFYDSLKPIVRDFEISNPDKLYRIINSYLIAADDIFKEQSYSLSEHILKSTVFRILLSHAKSIISMISDHSPSEIEKISEHKKYLFRSLPGSVSDIVSSKAYSKTVEALDKKLLKRNVSI